MSTDNGADELHDQMMTANRAYADAAGDGSGIPKLPARHAFVLTCMDARVDPLRLLGLELGDAHIVRNAGGRVSDDVVRSLVMSSALLGTRHVAVVHHTDCGLLADSDAAVRAELRDQGVEADEMEIGSFSDLDRSVRQDVETLAGEPHVGASLTVRGYVYDVVSRELRPVGA